MIQIKEVGPRDGLQNEQNILSVEDRITWIQKLEESGLTYIEVGAFVRPDLIPQMDQTDQVLEGLALSDDTKVAVLVPNEKGFVRARDAQVKEVAVVTAVSETFNQKNIRMSVEQSLSNIENILEQAETAGIKVRGYISTCFDCPFEGTIQADAVIPIIEKLLEMGCYEVSVGDTTGKATVEQVDKLFAQTFQMGLNGWLAGHFHNTYDLALASVQQSMLHDIKVFDTSNGGIGGCPYAPGAKGNLATEDLVTYCQDEKIKTSVNLKKLLQASKFIEEKIGHDLSATTKSAL